MLPCGDVYSFAHFFIFFFTNGFTLNGLNNEQFIEPHAFLMANDLALRLPTPSAVSMLELAKHRKTDKEIGAANRKYFERRSAANS
jgi:hypothetical protein